MPYRELLAWVNAAGLPLRALPFEQWRQLLVDMAQQFFQQLDTNTDQLYSSIFGKIIYQFKPRSKFNFDVGYRKQVGEQIDLELITSKLEYNTIYRTLYIKVGLEVYKRNYVGEQINFGGVYFQIDRKF